MKTLILFRHAKSSWKHEQLTDFERPLKQKGVLHAKKQAYKLKEKNIIPDQIVSSPAIRAINTAIIAAEVLKFPSINIVLEKSIYESTPQNLLSVVKSFSDDNNTVMLVGHNDSISELAELLVEKKLLTIPTAGFVVMAFPINTWAKVAAKTGKLVCVDFEEDEDVE